MKKIKVSELPICSVLKGLYTLGTDANNNSVKVSLEFVEEKTNAANTAAEQATAAATKATEAKKAADTAAIQATTAANNANTATRNANTATNNANAATTKANEAATTANNAASDATKTATEAAANAEKAIKAASDAAKDTVDKAAAAAAKTATDAAKTATDAATDARAAEAKAKTAAEEADIAAAAATQATEQLLFKLGTLIPTGLSVTPVPRLTIGNTAPVYIDAHLQPEQAAKNIIFISDNRAVSVTQDGRISVIGTGRSTIQVIPTLNTSLAKVIQVEVGQPTLRLVNTRTRLRFTASGALRLN